MNTKTLALASDLDAIRARIGKIQRDSPRQWGRMTPHQMICHLSDSYLSALGERPVSPADNVVSRTFIKWLALRVPAPWPKGVKTRPEVDQEDGGTPPAEFEADREKLVALVERFVSTPAGSLNSRHSIFGPMSRDEWMRWGFLHADHHLRQFGI